MTDLFLCVDPGASRTKVIYQLKGKSSPDYFLMSPDVEPISQRSLDLYFDSAGWIGHPSPAQQSWLHVNNRLFAVGTFASKFDPEDRIQEQKYENALYKVLAAVGIIIQQHNLNPKKKLVIQLALLLPANEYNDRQRFQEQLTRYLDSFSFRGQTLKLKLERFLCRPEGGGLASITFIRNGLDWFQQRDLAILVLGYRNVSALCFKRGEMTTLDSPLIGFSTFLDSVVKMTSGLERQLLDQALCRAFYYAGDSIFVRKHRSNIVDRQCNYTDHPKWQELVSIKNLATAKDSSLNASEVKSIVLAIDKATELYRLKLNKWMRRTFEYLDTVIIAGGAARFWVPELESYFNCEPIYSNTSSRKSSKEAYIKTDKYQAREPEYHFTPIIWSAGLQKKVITTFNLNEGNQSLSPILVDAYGLFDQLIGKNSSSKKSAKKSAKSTKSSSGVKNG